MRIKTATRTGRPTPQRTARATTKSAPKSARPKASRTAKRAGVSTLERATAAAATRLDGAPRTPRIIGPEQAGKVGDLVQAPPVRFSAAEVLAAKQRLDQKIAANPRVLATLRAAPFPKSPADAQLEWALARPSGTPDLHEPVWVRGSNDSRAALVAYAQGVTGLAARSVHLDDATERLATEALTQLPGDIATLQALQQQPFPSTAPLSEQLRWAAAMLYTWDWTKQPQVQADPLARAVVAFASGVQAKGATNAPPVPLVSERRTLSVDGDTRVFAIHTPRGTPPKEGWPTVLFFHGSFGGHAPEQTPEYQQLNALADAAGFQIVYPVGLPQDRTDASTGRGMLNWDPVGAGPGQANDRFVHTLLKQLTGEKGHDKADPARIFAAGHSQGGFYTSDLVAAYPDVFAGAAVLGAGLGTVAQGADLKPNRKTPTLLQVGVNDIHINLGDQLAARFKGDGFGDALRFDRLPNHGHEVTQNDLTQMLEFFAQQPRFTASKAGKLDGKTGSAGPRAPVFRDRLDLNDLPAGLRARPDLVRAVQSLAANPYLAVDQNQQTLTVDEWRLALGYRSTFPPAMQQAIDELRNYFVLAPPPGGALDLSNIPQSLRSSPNAMAAIEALVQTPALDLDGYPGLISAEEVTQAASMVQSQQLGPQVAAGLEELRAYFFGQAAPQVDLRPRHVEQLPGGAKLESYPGSAAAVQKMKALVAGLSADRRFASVLARTTLVISSPGRGVDAVPEATGLGPGVEGVATSFGFEGSGRTIPPPAFMVRQDSIMRWNLGAAHELLHLLRFDLGDGARARLDAVWSAIGGRDGAPDGYPNAEEMFAYFGQWYLAGFGEQLRQVSPEAYALVHDLIGNAQIDPGALTATDALTSLQGLLAWFRSGRHER